MIREGERNSLYGLRYPREDLRRDGSLVEGECGGMFVHRFLLYKLYSILKLLLVSINEIVHKNQPIQAKN
jgi:hypothetical protein